MTKAQAQKQILEHARAIMEIAKEYGHYDMMSMAIDPSDDYIDFNNGIFEGKHSISFTKFGEYTTKRRR